MGRFKINHGCFANEKSDQRILTPKIGKPRLSKRLHLSVIFLSFSLPKAKINSWFCYVTQNFSLFISDYLAQIPFYEEHAQKIYKEQERGDKKIDADITYHIYDATNIIPNQNRFTSHTPPLQPHLHDDENEKACEDFFSQPSFQ